KDVGFAVVSGSLEGKSTELVVAMYAQPASGTVLAGSNNPVNIGGQFQAPEGSAQNPITRFGSILQSLNPAALGSLAVFIVAFGVAMLTYANRKKLPRSLRKAWYAHHSLYKAGSFAILALLVVAISGGG